MLILGITLWLLYGGVARLWWGDDDLFLLHFVTVHSPIRAAFSPRVWNLLPFKMFTPLLLESYGLDRALFGWNPASFHVHQLVVFGLAAAALYVLLRVWLPWWLAGAAVALFVLGVPSEVWVIKVMFRHYAEGLLFAALAVWLFAVSLRSERWVPAALFSSLLYLLAMLEKEVYVPLLALLWALPMTAFSIRLRRAVPHAAALSLYLVWRGAMLGTVAGGYGWVTRAGELPGLLWRLPVSAMGSWAAGWAFPGLLLLAGLLTGIGVLAWRRPRSLGFLALAFLLIVGPILPVAKSATQRFGVLPWLAIVVAFAFGCREISAAFPRARSFLPALLLVFILLALVVNRRDWNRRYAEAERMSDEGRFFLAMSPGDLLKNPRIPAAAMKETRWLKEDHLGLPAGAGWFADDIYLCSARPASGRIWQYDGGSKHVRDVTQEAWEQAARYCSQLRPAPLEARFQSGGGRLLWHLGPYEKGRYWLVFDGGVEAVPVSRDDGYQISPGVLSLMLRYQAPEGWNTYSPQLKMDFQAASRYRWERPGPVP